MTALLFTLTSSCKFVHLIRKLGEGTATEVDVEREGENISENNISNSVKNVFCHTFHPTYEMLKSVQTAPVLAQWAEGHSCLKTPEYMKTYMVNI